jgi:hypothetical protein
LQKSHAEKSGVRPFSFAQKGTTRKRNETIPEDNPLNVHSFHADVC